MTIKMLSIVVLSMGTALATPCVAHRSVHQNVLIKNGYGKTIMKSHYIWLSPQCVGTPVSLVKAFNLGFGYDKDTDDVYVFVPETDATVGFKINGHRLSSPLAGPEFDPHVYRFPVAVKRGGQIYVSAHLLHESYPEFFDLKWSKQRQVLTLQYRPGY